MQFRVKWRETENELNEQKLTTPMRRSISTISCFSLVSACFIRTRGARKQSNTGYERISQHEIQKKTQASIQGHHLRGAKNGHHRPDSS